MPAITVIVPVYNGEDYLRRCVDSILSQTFLDFELILVDDGSVSYCSELCDVYASENKCVTVIHQENGGVSKARNIGLRLAQGHFVVFCDGDDYFKCDLLEKAYKAITESGSDIVSYSMRRLSGNLNPQNNYISDTSEITLCNNNRFEFIYSVIRCETGGWQACRSMFSRNIISKYSVYFCESCNNYAEDLGFTVEYLFHASKISFLNDDLYVYDDMRETSMMHKNKDASHINDINNLSAYLHSKYLTIGDSDPYCVLHHYLIRNTFTMLYGARKFHELISWIKEAESISNKRFFKNQNAMYTNILNSKFSKQMLGKRIKEHLSLTHSINEYLTYGNKFMFILRYFIAKYLLKLK